MLWSDGMDLFVRAVVDLMIASRTNSPRTPPGLPSAFIAMLRGRQPKRAQRCCGDYVNEA